MYTDPPTSWTRDTKTPSTSFGVCCNPRSKGNNHSERWREGGRAHSHTRRRLLPLLIYLCCWVFMYIHFAVVLVAVVVVVVAAAPDRVVRVVGLG